jgi:hypothetical protein
MQNDHPGNDPRTVWQNQPTEPSAMTLLLIRKKTRELRAKTHRELLKSIAGPTDCHRPRRFRSTVLRSSAASSIRVLHGLEYRRAVFPQSGIVVRTEARRRCFNRQSAVLPAGGRAATFPF